MQWQESGEQVTKQYILYYTSFDFKSLEGNINVVKMRLILHFLLYTFFFNFPDCLQGMCVAFMNRERGLQTQ